MKITINHNGFHGLTSRTISVHGWYGDLVCLSDSQVRKLARAACGSSTCKCGESLLIACEYFGDPKHTAVYFKIPAEGNEINVRGNYPQN